LLFVLRMLFGIRYKLPLVVHIWGIWKQTKKTKKINKNFQSRRLANAEHSCAGHEISLFFSMRSFYLSIYDVSDSF